MMNPRAKDILYKSPYHLIITFTNGEIKSFNIQPYLDYPAYQDLKNEAYCSKAKINNGTVVWDEEIDFDPNRLYLESESVVD